MLLQGHGLLLLSGHTLVTAASDNCDLALDSQAGHVPGSCHHQGPTSPAGALPPLGRLASCHSLLWGLHEVKTETTHLLGPAWITPAPFCGRSPPGPGTGGHPSFSDFGRPSEARSHRLWVSPAPGPSQLDVARQSGHVCALCQEQGWTSTGVGHGGLRRGSDPAEALPGWSGG